MDGASMAGSTNGLSEPAMANIVRALELIYDSKSTNEIRKEASHFLESQKQEKTAAYNGFMLASQQEHPPMIRYFGLSLMEHVLRHMSSSLSTIELGELRGLILQLCQSIRVQDPAYVRNKIAQLWADVAKRTWGIDWIGMDESLVELWGGDLVHRELVLSVLETLSEDVFYREDTVSSLRGTDLNKALVEIFTPQTVFEHAFPEREHGGELRCGPEGWLLRICDFLDTCVPNISHSKEAKDCALRALETLRSAMSWAIPKAVEAAHCIASVCRSLISQDDQVLMAAVEALHALYGRLGYDVDESQELVYLVYQTDHLTLLRKLYEWSVVQASDIEETKYTISKKLSELMSYVAGFLEEKEFLLKPQHHAEPDLPFFFHFLISILRHQSLVVSIPVLHSWSRLLTHERLSNLEIVTSLIAPLLEICTQRLVRYETLPEDSDNPTVLFLNEDIDTIPERHAFVGNYRRYCSQIIEIIVQQRPEEAIPHILSTVDFNLNQLYNQVPPFDSATFKKSSLPLMRADTQFTVVEATLKGYSKWVLSHGKTPQNDEQKRSALENIFETWALNLMQRNIEDPAIKQRIIKLVVDISGKALDSRPSFALKVLEHILMTEATDRPELPVYSESVKELHAVASHELRRLAIRYADYFSTFYDVLEPKIKEIVSARQMESRPQTDLTSILLIIMQRAGSVDPYLRQTRLQSFVDPIKQTWTNQELKQVLSSFRGFCQLLGVEQVGQYLQERRAQSIEDWSAVLLDDKGKDIQTEMTSKFQQLPLRGTKTMLAVSTEKLKKAEPAYQIACDLWGDSIPVVLPTLLQFISNAHAFHNPANWAGLPAEMQSVVGRILMDRFWQAGISAGSREEFYAKIATSRATLEGFSSSVRGKIRAVRESCYSILFSMSRLGPHFYGFEELAVPLSQAMFADAIHLSSHQFSVLLNISRCLIDDCPAKFRGHFLPPMLSNLLTQVDKKITNEWDIIERRKAGIVDDDLTEEMKDESILRQLTHSVVMMIASLLDPQRGDPEDPVSQTEPGDTRAPPPLTDSIRHFVLNSPEILEPVILFCTHALRMHDSRCCSIIARVIRSILPEFVPSDDTPTSITIREFISTDVLKACITSVHDPYFVDLQKELAHLISTIWTTYGPRSATPRSVIMSLPGMSEQRVASTEASLVRSTSSRQQRALVLDLLDDLRGVSISEQGKITGTREDRRKARSAMQQRYMTLDVDGQQGRKRDMNDEPDLSGIAAMFG